MVEKHKVILAFDFGMKKIGVAIGQTLTRSARPLGIITAKNGVPNQQQLDDIIASWKPNIIIVGIPKNPEENIKSHTEILAQKFADTLNSQYKHKFNLTVETVDESFTSIEAKEKFKLLRQDNLIKKGEPLDPIAACLILERWFGLN